MKNPPQSPDRGRGAPRAARTGLLVVALIAVMTCAVRYRLIDIPLERDEGGFAYMGRLILDGVPPYTQAYDYKPPGLYLTYAASIALFGGGASGIHAALLLASLGSMALLYYLVRWWSDATGAAVSAFLLSVLLVSPSLLGFAAHATHFVVFWALLGCLLLEWHIRAGGAWRALAAGAAFCCSALMKQPGVFFLLFGLALPFATRRDRGARLREPIVTAGLLTGGFLVPLAGTVAWLGASGALDGFLYWNFTYPSMVAGGASATGLLPRVFRVGVLAMGNFLPVWVAAVAGFMYMMSVRGNAGARTRIALLGACSVAALFAGYETRSHYFVLVLPAIAASAGLAVSSLAGLLRPPTFRGLVVAVPCLLAGIGVVGDRQYFFIEDPATISRSIYRPNQFADAERVAAFIRAGTSDTDRVAILGSEPEILFLAGRRSATRHIFANFLNERHGLKERMEAEMIREIDSVGPAMIVLMNQPFSWGALPGDDWSIIRWAKEYLARHYVLAGTVTPDSPQSSKFRWEEEARGDTGALRAPMMIYRRAGGIAGPKAPGP